MTKDEALKLALEAMTYADACLKKQLTTKDKHEYAQDLLLEAGAAIKEALAQPEQGPMHYYRADAKGNLKRIDIHSAQPEQEPVAWEQLRETRQAIIAGALFDFMGWLTSRKERIVLSSADEASPAADAIKNFAKMRGLSLDDAKVQDWNTTPPQRTWVGLTDEEIKALASWWPSYDQIPALMVLAKDIQNSLKEKNT